MEHSNALFDMFFSRSYENKINEEMFYRNYDFPYEEVMEYVSNVINIDIVEFIEYIRKCLSVSFIEYSDIIQFSSLNDSTIRIAAMIEDNGDAGFSFIDLGKLLLNDGKVRNDTAYRKYGENHTKTAKEFGITQLIFSRSYLTCIGKVINLLPQEDKDRLLRRLILRNKFFMLIIKLSANETITIENQMTLLSESTKTRRLSNIRKVWKFIISERDLEQNLSNVIL